MSEPAYTLSVCPFCGHQPEEGNLDDAIHPINRTRTVWQAGCIESEGGCDALVLADSRQGAIDKWNGRTTPQPEPLPAPAQPPETMTLQQVWDAAGANPGIKPTRADVMLQLGLLDKICDQADEAQPAPAVPAGYALVPIEPTEAMWGGLARDIVFFYQTHSAQHYGSKLHKFLGMLGRDIPDWLAVAIPNVDHSPAKGTVVYCIYKAMLADAPQPEPLPPAHPILENYP